MSRPPSKSARKRDQHARQQLGERLVGLAPEQLSQIPLEDNLRDAIIAARSIRSRGALRRQNQLIGKLMREIDLGPVESALHRATRADRLSRDIFRRAESWRDRLLTGGTEAYREFAAAFGDAPPELAELLRATARSGDADSRRHLGRKVFRLVRAQIDADVQNRTPGG